MAQEVNNVNDPDLGIRLNTNLTNELDTVLDFMRWGASQFVNANLSYSHGLSTPLDESVYLVLRSLKLPVDTPDVYWQSKLTQVEKQTVLSTLIKRIEEKIPAAYITQEGWFAGLQFYVDERVLVPRSPIAGFRLMYGQWVYRYRLRLCFPNGTR